MKVKKTGIGWKIKIGKGKAKHTVKLPIIEAVIIGVGLVEGFMIGGITGALLGVALGGLAILTCIFCVFPFLGLLIYHWIMTFAFGIAQVNMKCVYLVGFICGLYVTWETLKAVFELLAKKGKKIEKSKVTTYELKKK